MKSIRILLLLVGFHHVQRGSQKCIRHFDAFSFTPDIVATKLFTFLSLSLAIFLAMDKEKQFIFSGERFESVYPKCLEKKEEKHHSV